MLKLNVPGPKALALIERDRKFVSSSYPRGYPFVMDHGKGVEAWDPDGNRFIDVMSGITVLSTGDSNTRSSGTTCLAMRSQASSSNPSRAKADTLFRRMGSSQPFASYVISMASY